MPFSNILAAYLPSDTIRKISFLMVLIWSTVGFTSSVYVILLPCRLALALPKAFIGRSSPASPQRTGFRDKERTQANSIIQYYGTVPRIEIRDLRFVPLDAAFAAVEMFYYHWCDRHCCLWFRIYLTMLKKRKKAPYYRAPAPTEN